MKKIVLFSLLIITTIIAQTGYYQNLSDEEKEKLKNNSPQYLIDSLENEQKKGSSVNLSISDTIDNSVDNSVDNRTGDTINFSVKDSLYLEYLLLNDSLNRDSSKLFDDSVKHLKYSELDEDSEYKKQIIGDSSELKIFGMDFIESLKYSAPDFGPVSSEYIVGVGDEIVVIVWGDVQFNSSLEITRMGTISPKGIGQITVAGKSLKEIEKLLIKRFSRIYSGVKYGKSNATTFVDVTIGRMRKKQVYIVGDVKFPGTYSIPSLAGPLGAISFSGGPTEKGSLRDIYISRGNSIIDTVDLYGFLLSGEINDTIFIADQDVIIIPPVKNRVTLDGAVHRPAIYELKSNENLTDLLKYAGGFIPESNRNSCNIIRSFENSERKLITVDSINKDKTVELFKNDEVTINYLDFVNNIISVEGAVKYPGEFAYSENISLLDIIRLAGGVNDDYFPDRLEILRTYDDYKKEVISVNIGTLLDSTDLSQNIKLRKWDKIKILSLWDFKFRKFISISGEVNNPGKYFLRDSMTIQDILILAGGFTEKASKESVELSRIISSSKESGNSSEITKIEISSEFYENSSNKLQHMDNVFVRENSSLKEQEVVYLGGEFSYPGYYSKLNDSETLLSVIKRSGGIKNSGYIEGARFTRSKDSVGTVAINLIKLLDKEKSKDDIILEDGDSLLIPTFPKTVKVLGSVNYPTAVKFIPGKDISYYIKRAGGFSQTGDKKSVFVMLANGEVKSVKKRSNTVNAGSVITVPELIPDDKPPFNWGAFAQSLLAISTSIATIATLVITLR
jgi:protein involved in polysaccharide export with SLBB domain